jgi:hypothetical protein
LKTNKCIHATFAVKKYFFIIILTAKSLKEEKG